MRKLILFAAASYPENHLLGWEVEAWSALPPVWRLFQIDLWTIVR